MPTLERILVWMVLGTCLTAIAAGGSAGIAHTMSLLATFAVILRVYHDRVAVPLQRRIAGLEQGKSPVALMVCSGCELLVPSSQIGEYLRSGVKQSLCDDCALVPTKP